MKRLATAVALALCLSQAQAGRFLKGTRAGGGSATVTWVAPALDVAAIGGQGGSAASVAGYKVYKSTTSRIGPWTLVADVGAVSSYNVPGLTSGTWYICVASYDASGYEGPCSYAVEDVTP